MSKSFINILFSRVILVSVGIILLAFFTWNDPRSYGIEPGQQMTLVRVEQCHLHEKRHKVEIKGWGYVEEHPHGFFQVYGQIDNGLYRKFETFSRERVDVTKSLKLDESYKLMGFEASYRGLSSNYTGRIMVRMVNPKGEVFSASYQCS